MDQVNHENIINKLKQIKTFMYNEGFLKVKKTLHSRDGRIESMLGEDNIVKILTDKFNFVKANNSNRDLGDIYIIINENKYPINIKLYNSKKKSASNMFGLFRTYEYIFGLKAGGSLTKLCSQLVENDINYWMKIELKDYYFLFFNKNNYKDVRFGSFLTMDDKYIVVNPKNGFQCRFDKVTFNNKVTKDQIIKKLITKFELYLKKLAEPYLQYSSLKQINQF
jgi:hypothetical protein